MGQKDHRSRTKGPASSAARSTAWRSCRSEMFQPGCRCCAVLYRLWCWLFYELLNMENDNTSGVFDQHSDSSTLRSRSREPDRVSVHSRHQRTALPDNNTSPWDRPVLEVKLVQIWLWERANSRWCQSIVHRSGPWGEVGLKSRLIGGGASQSQHRAGCLNRKEQLSNRLSVMCLREPGSELGTSSDHAVAVCAHFCITCRNVSSKCKPASHSWKPVNHRSRSVRSAWN